MYVCVLEREDWLLTAERLFPLSADLLFSVRTRSEEADFRVTLFLLPASLTPELERLRRSLCVLSTSDLTASPSRALLVEAERADVVPALGPVSRPTITLERVDLRLP